jgi:hypothetical protein
MTYFTDKTETWKRLPISKPGFCQVPDESKNTVLEEGGSQMEVSGKLIICTWAH